MFTVKNIVTQRYNKIIYIYVCVCVCVCVFEKNKMGGECSSYGGEERRAQGFGRETWRKVTTWETQV
jgi:ribose/xylose/arabinose/galactoside ABC-type transport system permease subunit